MRRMLIVATALMAVGACSKGKQGPAGVRHVDDTPHTDKVVQALKGAGLNTEPFAPVQPPPLGAVICEQGRVSGVDALVCEYADDAALERGKKELLDRWAKDNIKTGVTSRSRKTMLAVVDRTRADPNGKTISQILKAFKKL